MLKQSVLVLRKSLYYNATACYDDGALEVFYHLLYCTYVGFKRYLEFDSTVPNIFLPRCKLVMIS